MSRGRERAAALLAAALLWALPLRAQGPIDWPAYGRDPGGSRYSPAAAITRENVAHLDVVWTYRTGDYAIGDGATRFESTPLLVDGTLYVSTPFGRVIALDPLTGDERWAFDPRIDLQGRYGDFANRGVATWLDAARADGEPCGRRIFVAPIDARLVALDASTGHPCSDFGSKGQVDLNRDLINAPFERGEYQVTSPPAVVGDLVVVGSAVADNNRFDAPSGVVRAFDARSGRERWAWDPIPRRPGAAGYDTWHGPRAHRTGAANVWSVMSVDSERDLVFVPTSSGSPDFYGGERLGKNLYANSLVALRGSTGQIVWHFQAVHHDLWDYDLPAQPVLATLRRGGRDLPAVIQATKMGHLFVLHRETGEPLLPIEERPVPPSDVPGEEAWPTQPFPIVPRPLVPASLGSRDAWGLTPEDREWCRGELARLRSEGIFTPPSLGGAVIFPGNIGGSNWGGVSVDPVRGILVAPTNRMATVVRLVPRADFEAARARHPDWQATPQRGTPYGMVRRSFFAPGGLPCNPPPWGTLTAVDLATGTTRWEVPLGFMPGLEGVPDAARWGSINLGGALVTGGGLVFIAATLDQHLRAFDVESGRELWRTPLPAGGVALPMTYQLSGRQYIVIAAGGREPRWKQGDYVIAFGHPTPGVRSSVAVSDLAGSYTGEFVVERNRWSATLELRPLGRDSVTGTLGIAAPAITATLGGSRADNRVSWTAAFSYPERNCSGTMRGDAELANGGRLFVGEVQVSGGCSGEGAEVGTFALRRP